MAETQGSLTKAKNALAVTLALAVVLNLADALWNPSGGFWLTARVVASVVFTVALVVFIAAYLRSRRRQNARE